jgi:hypothetical protein
VLRLSLMSAECRLMPCFAQKVRSMLLLHFWVYPGLAKEI